MEPQTDDFMRQLPRPEVAAPQYQQQLRLTLLSPQRTAALGVWLVLTPVFFLACVVMKYAFSPPGRFLDVFLDAAAGFGHTPQGRWLVPVLFLLLPLLGVALNLLSVLRVRFDRASRQLHLSLQLHWLNLLLIGLSLLVVGTLAGYVLLENLASSRG